jgi:hypothetical protein
MDEINKNLKIINRLSRYFIIVGFIEIFLYVFISPGLIGMIIGMIPGLITIIPAYLALKEKKIKMNYFVGIWAIIKYNPIIGIALTAFILGDMSRVYGRHNMFENNYVITFILCFALLIITSFVSGIILIIKTNQHYNLQRDMVF